VLKSSIVNNRELKASGLSFQFSACAPLDWLPAQRIYKLADKTVASVSQKGANHPAQESEDSRQRVALLMPAVGFQGSSKAVQHGNLMANYRMLRHRLKSVGAVAALSSAA
jgi:hypothetical protein